jgi:hypothetical protein
LQARLAIETGKIVLLKAAKTLTFSKEPDMELEQLLKVQPDLRHLERLVCQFIGGSDVGPRGNKVNFIC